MHLIYFHKNNDIHFSIEELFSNKTIFPANCIYLCMVWLFLLNGVSNLVEWYIKFGWSFNVKSCYIYIYIYIYRLHVNAHKTEYMCHNQTGDSSTLGGTSLKLVDKFTYLGSSVSSTEEDIDTRLTKAWTAIDRLSIIWRSDLTDKMKRSFFQAAVVSILLYGCTTWTLTKRLEKKLDGNYTRMLRAILNKSWRQHPTRHQLYGHLPPITKTIQVRRARHAGHCWRSRDELISDVLLWTPTYGRAKARRPARTYIQQLCEDMGCSPEDLPEEMNDREKRRDLMIRIYTYIYIYIYSRWLAIVKGDLKTPFSIAITPRCRGGPNSFPWTYIYIYIYIGCINTYRARVTANNSTNNNVVFLFCFGF